MANVTFRIKVLASKRHKKAQINTMLNLKSIFKNLCSKKFGFKHQLIPTNTNQNIHY